MSDMILANVGGMPITSADVDAFLAGCREPWEFAEHFGVPEDFIAATMQNYRQRYGTLATVSTQKGIFALSFEPTLRVRRLQRAPRGKRKMEVAP